MRRARADVAHLRGDVDDGARALCRHQATGDRLRDEEGSTHVEREDGVEILDLHVHEIGRPVGAGIVDQNVEGLGRCDRRAHRRNVGDVERQRRGASPARADRRRRRLDLGRGARRERHMRAGLRERRAGRQSDAAAAAGDERAPAVETEGWRCGEVHRD